jgi:peptidase S24-like protein
MTSAEGALQSLSADEIDAVALLWKRQGRQFVTSFSGTSMLPAIAPGQLVSVTCGVEPMVGDVAVFRYSDQVGVHRVVGRTASWFLTWGDNNPLPDEPVTPVRIIGAIRDVPAAKKSLRRRMLLWFLGSPNQPIDVLTHRIRLVYRARTVWKQGPLVFARTLLRALIRRTLPS